MTPGSCQATGLTTRPPCPQSARLSPYLGLELDLEEARAEGQGGERKEDKNKAYECLQLWQAPITSLSWFQLIKCSQQFCEGGSPRGSR